MTKALQGGRMTIYITSVVDVFGGFDQDTYILECGHPGGNIFIETESYYECYAIKAAASKLKPSERIRVDILVTEDADEILEWEITDGR